MTVRELRNILNKLDDDLEIHKIDGSFLPRLKDARITKVVETPPDFGVGVTNVRVKYMIAERWFGRSDTEMQNKRGVLMFDALIIK